MNDIDLFARLNTLLSESGHKIKILVVGGEMLAVRGLRSCLFGTKYVRMPQCGATPVEVLRAIYTTISENSLGFEWLLDSLCRHGINVHSIRSTTLHEMSNIEFYAPVDFAQLTLKLVEACHMSTSLASLCNSPETRIVRQELFADIADLMRKLPDVTPAKVMKHTLTACSAAYIDGEYVENVMGVIREELESEHHLSAILERIDSGLV